MKSKYVTGAREKIRRQSRIVARGWEDEKFGHATHLDELFPLESDTAVAFSINVVESSRKQADKNSFIRQTYKRNT